ncbi:MAG: calcium/sodium antiporter [Zoogloeaceae bacterium]|nr:calcium/sodium antiporter [Zoogloeaceae bacterium]
MLNQVLFFVLGLVTLVVSAELLVRGASRFALSLGVSPLVVGLTVVAFGTSAPEMAVSVGAALAGNPDLAVGNVVGSNIANVLLILGISAIIAPLVVNEQIIRQEIPIMIGSAALMVVMALDGNISRVEAGVLFALVIGYTVFLVRQSRQATRATNDEFAEDMPADSDWDRHWSVQLGLIVVGLVGLVQGSDWLVGAAIAFAQAFGVSDLVIGLTVVAVGTSMPEIATSIIAAIRGQRDIAVGNVVGSNVFNIFGVIGVTGLVSTAGIPISETARSFDLWVMLAVAFACLPIMATGREIARWEGGVFLAYYASYTAYLVLSAQQHAFLPTFSNIMTGFVMPLTVIVLILKVMQHNGKAGAGV